MKKFLAWFLGVLLVIITPVMVFFYNFKHVVFSPEATKNMLIQIDFYNQAKSVIKSAMLEAGDNSAEMQFMTQVTRMTMDNYNFQPKIEAVIDDFYAGLVKNNGDFLITINLADIKQLMMQNALALDKDLPSDFSELLIPDQWQVNLSKSSQPWIISTLAFFYNNFAVILIVYGILVLLFLLFSILPGIRYLKLFFAVFLISGVLIFLQRALWWLVNPRAIFSSITDQGNTGLQILMENLTVYLRTKTVILLTWESAVMVMVSIIGLIIFSFLGQNKTKNIPLYDKK